MQKKPKITSPFAKYRGIANPGIPSGRAGVIRFVRRLRRSVVSALGTNVIVALVGAHAFRRGGALLTLDNRLYRFAFPALDLATV